MKNILIIGASSGIGRQTALQASEAGYNVYGTYFKNGNEIPPNIHSCFLDAQNPVFEDGFLPEVLDGFVYCPGSIQLKPFHRISAESFTADFELNVASGIRVLQWVLPLLKKSEAASVLFFSTVAVQSGFSFHAQVSASKGALEGLTLCSSDPLCADHTPENDGATLHGACCHACLFAPETSCERGNRYLDRTVLVETVRRANIGLFEK